MCSNLVTLRSDLRSDFAQRQRANVSAKLQSYEDLGARMDDLESLVEGHFNADPDRAMTRSEWEAIVQDSAKKAADARELLHEEDKMREKAKAVAAPATPRQMMAHKAPVRPIDDTFGALREGMEEAPPYVPLPLGGVSLHLEASYPRE